MDPITSKETELIRTLEDLEILKDWATTVEGDEVWFFDDDNTKRIDQSQILQALRHKYARQIIEALLSVMKSR